MSERVGLIGLGIMGRGMADNLLRKGWELGVWNRTAERMEPFVQSGARGFESPAALAAWASLIIVCVSNTQDVEAVLLGEGGVIEGAQQGLLVVDTSTISPHATVDLAARLAERGARLLDAPVSGGSEGAAKGTLSIMVGGAAEDVERALPVLQAIGARITHIGGQGAGQMTKLVNQILVVGSMLAMGEALVFAQAGGLDLEKVLEAVSGGAAGSWTLTNRGPQVLRRDWRPGFTIDLQQKDLRLVLEAADHVGAPVLGTALAFQLYRTLEAAGLGGEGNHALVKALERLAGVEVGGAD